MQQYFLRLVYVSNAVAPIGAAMLDKILDSAGQHNAKAGITGVLCSGRHQFLQVLEGPERHLLDLYARIAADARHCDVTLLGIELAADRMFPQWSMGHVDGPANAYGALLAQRLIDGDRKRVAGLLRDCLADLRGAAPGAVRS